MVKKHLICLEESLPIGRLAKSKNVAWSRGW
jgi:phosphoribosyl-dephospho-CoA transferase